MPHSYARGVASNESRTGFSGQGPPPPPPPPPSSHSITTPQMQAYGYGQGPYRPPQRLNYLAPGQAPLSSVPPAVKPPEAKAPSTLSTPVQANSKNTSWFCDACDLALESQQALKSHRKSHVKCTECSFEGAPKIVKAHYQGSHGKFSVSGFKTVTVAIPGCRVQRFRICVGNRPEDIQRWLAERKRRFPRQNTSQNEAGEDREALKETEKNDASQGMSSLLAGYGSSGSESENEQAIQDGEKTTANNSSTSPQKNDESETVANDPAKSTGAALKSRPCRYFMRNGSCLNGDTCRFSHEIPMQRFPSDNGARKRKRGGHATSDTLLRKLLANDMERESILTMQLLEFIVDKDFFD